VCPSEGLETQEQKNNKIRMIRTQCKDKCYDSKSQSYFEKEIAQQSKILALPTVAIRSIQLPRDTRPREGASGCAAG